MHTNINSRLIAQTASLALPLHAVTACAASGLVGRCYGAIQLSSCAMQKWKQDRPGLVAEMTAPLPRSTKLTSYLLLTQRER